MKTAALILGWFASIIVAFLLGDYVKSNRSTVIPTEYGRFLSTPKFEALPDGRSLKLLEDFVYVDPNENPWLAATGRVVDGASIPRIFWTATGGPLTGKYRNASIVHDVECEDRKRPHTDVHLMFFHACLAGGVQEREAKRLYWAVARFGPRWVSESRSRTIEYTNEAGVSESVEMMYPVTVPLSVEPPTEDDVTWAKEFFEHNDPPVEVIPSLGPASGEVP